MKRRHAKRSLLMGILLTLLAAGCCAVPSAAGELPGADRATDGGAEAYVRWIETCMDDMEKQLPAITRSAEEAADLYVDVPKGYGVRAEGRPLTIGAGTYLASPDEMLTPVRIRVTGPRGKVLNDGEVKPRYDNHARRRILTIPASGAGGYRVDVDAVRWFPWTEPAPPVVIAGQPTEDGGARFSLETGTVRQWYLRVPKGTKQFRVGVVIRDPQHALRVAVHAPNRLVDELYARGGARQEVVVGVPPGLSGLIWFLRTELGGSTRFVSGKGNPRQLTVEADIELHGVPGFLAPTWGQWFDPAADNRKGQ